MTTSPAERADALAWAADVRRVRHETRTALHRGERSLDDVLADAEEDPRIGHQKLLWVLESLPGASKVATRRALAALGIDGGRLLGSLSDVERSIVLLRFSPQIADEVGS